MDDKEKAAEEVKEVTESKDVDSKEVDKMQADSKDKTQELGQRKNKKVIYGIVIEIIILIVCIGLYTFMDQQRKQEILDNIQITFVDDLEIEYGEQDYDFSQLIKEKSDEVTLPDKIDTMILGEKEVIFTVEKEGLHKEFPVKVKVTDTKAPEIALKEDVITLEYESDYDIKENIESVKDPVDGDISFAESAGENNYYVVEGTIDTTTAGEYTITVKAVDKNKISSEKAYIVNVNEKEEVQAPKQSQSGGNKPPVSNNGASSNNGGASSGNLVEEPHYRTDISNTYAAQINAYRQENGLAALPITGEAQAQANTRAMQIVTSYGHDSSSWGENIGMGDANYNFFEGWKASPGHNGAMLESSMYDAIAVSVVEYNGKWYAVTVFHNRWS